MVIIEPLDKSKQDRAAFTSGVPQVDRYLKETASRLMKAGTARVFVMVDPQRPEEIPGFYSINAHSVRGGDLPKCYRRVALADGTLPAAFIGMIGVAEHSQGQGIGSRRLGRGLPGLTTDRHCDGAAGYPRLRQPRSRGTATAVVRRLWLSVAAFTTADSALPNRNKHPRKPARHG